MVRKWFGKHGTKCCRWPEKPTLVSLIGVQVGLNTMKLGPVSL